MNVVLVANAAVPALLAAAYLLRRRSADLRVVMVVACALAAAYFVYEGPVKMSRAHGDDFNQYLVGASELLAGRDPYADFAAYKAGNGGPIPEILARYDIAETTEISYPPPFYVAAAPLLLLSYDAAFLTWSIFNAVLLVVTVILVIRTLGLRDPGAYAAALTFTFLANPVLDNVHHGQANVILAALLALMLWGLERDKPAVAGLAAGAATLLKLYPGLFLIYFALRRRWRAFAFALGILLAAAVVAAAAWGPGIWLSYARNIVVPTMRASVLIVVNMAPVTFLSRLAAGTAAAAPLAVASKAVAVAAFALFVFWLRNPRLDAAGEAALVAAAMLALNNWVIQASCVVLIITYAYLGREAMARRLGAWPLLLAAVSLVALAFRYGYDKRWALSWPASWLLAIKPAALLLLVAAMAWLALARPGRAARGET